MRRALTALAVSAAALAAAPALAKEGVTAKLVDPVRLGAKPGTKLRFDLRLRDERGRPFGAGGLYLRVLSCRRKVTHVPLRERSRGRFAATVIVPRGRIRRVTVGLPGWRMYPDGTEERADAFFAFDPPLARPCR